MLGDVKQVIVMRTDLGMRKGKMIAQGANASMGAILKSSYFYDDNLGEKEVRELRIKMSVEMYKWLYEGKFTKICVRVDSEEQLLDINQMGKGAGLPVALITDSGKTEFGGVPTNTCLAIGPALSEDIDKITGDLKLL